MSGTTMVILAWKYLSVRVYLSSPCAHCTLTILEFDTCSVAHFRSFIFFLFFYLYFSWFASYPELMHIFHVEDYRTIEEIVGCPMMVQHIGHLKKVFSHVVTNIFNTHEVYHFLVSLGKRHCSYGAEQKYAQVSLLLRLFHNICRR